MSGSTTDRIEIVVNGRLAQVSPGLGVAGVLRELGIEADRVAVELNRAIVRKENWPETLVDEGAVLEIVQFVGGG